MDHGPTIPPPDRLLAFDEKVVLVTGAGRGIGVGIARRFAQAGAKVAANFRRSATGAEQVVELIREAGGQAEAIAADVTVKQDVERLVRQAAEALGGLDVLINNAGDYPRAPLLEMSEDAWDEVIRSNLRSVYLCTQQAATQMIAQGTAGAIVNIASIEAENPAAHHSHYNAAKGGVIMHTRAAAYELAPHGIRVNAVSPGLIWQPGLDEDWPEGMARWKKRAPLRRVGYPEDVADACLFLASPAARWITGVNLRVDGGVMSTPSF